ncbi:hypothetical protein Tco_1285674 [Tanacetum coccineum]
MGYSFYSPSENKVFVARNAEFFESKLYYQKQVGVEEDLETNSRTEDINPSSCEETESKDVKHTAKGDEKDMKRMVGEYLGGDGKKSGVVQEEEECGELNKNNVKPVNGNDLVVVLMSEQQTRNLVRQKLKEKPNLQKRDKATVRSFNDNEGVDWVSRTTGLVNERKREDESKSESRSVLLESSRKPRELNRNMKLQTGSEKAKDQKLRA